MQPHRVNESAPHALITGPIYFNDVVIQTNCTIVSPPNPHLINSMLPHQRQDPLANPLPNQREGMRVPHRYSSSNRYRQERSNYTSVPPSFATYQEFATNASYSPPLPFPSESFSFVSRAEASGNRNVCDDNNERLRAGRPTRDNFHRQQMVDRANRWMRRERLTTESRRTGPINQYSSRNGIDPNTIGNLHGTQNFTGNAATSSAPAQTSSAQFREDHHHFRYLPVFAQNNRVTLINFRSVHPETFHIIQQEQTKFGYRFDKHNSKPKNYPFFYGSQNYFCTFEIGDPSQLEILKLRCEEDARSGVIWWKVFSLSNMTSDSSVFWPYELLPLQLMRTIILSQKFYNDDQKGIAITGADMETCVNSKEQIRGAMACPETMYQLTNAFNERGKRIMAQVFASVNNGIENEH